MNSENLNTALQYANDYYIHLNKVNIGNRANNATINFMAEKMVLEMKEENKEEVMKKIKKVIKKEEPDVTLEEM